ncbi:hypothetical protein KBY58_02645 [Cyanobium sp. HWJ4-Hawea]|uniref:hypothetical protein n=1 Tax=unclassified Cyanobium TaxID=2627006 RepID=UPI0020CDD652|nr:MULTISPECIES: hypothetical protein [unclassified Cyanobium]MCP9775998.1 hypothetical protein [Cyanobium sp. WAJ14-Wanaka]MCP9808330.1 hypothetical protein [Cyanobium sp. HWJ4-Hawea]
MAGIPDRAYNGACGKLASQLGISLASARRKVEVRAAQQDIRDSQAKLALAEQLLAEALAGGENNHELLTSLLEAVGNDDKFMVED